MTVEVSLSAFELGPYLVGRRLGHGGMGEVYAALRRDGAGPPVALKLLLQHLSDHPPAVHMFLNEARLAARMTHPNVVRILDVGADQGRYYLAMEMVRGVPLTAVIAEVARLGATLPPGLVVHLAHGLFQGLHHAHTMHDEFGLPLAIVHRDVSPHNVLVSVDGEVKITDFGIAQAQTSPHFTQPGRVRGKCEYLAPEQARGEWVDARADLFAAAVTMAHVATLKSPFMRGGISETMGAVVNEPFPDLLALRGDLDPRLAAALARAAAKDPAARFQTGKEVCEALPPAPPDAQEQLAALVRQLCQPALDATIDATRELETDTRLLPRAQRRDTEPPSGPTVLEALPPRPWGRYAIAAGVVFVLGAAVAAITAPARAKPTPLPPALARIEAPPPPPVEPAAPIEAPAAAPAVDEAPEPSPRRARSMGFLTVDAVPWAEVWLDGRRIGETPLAELPVPAGKQRVVLKNPSTGASISRTVVVRRGHESIVKEVLR